MAEMKLFPIGYIATDNSNSLGNYTSGQLAASATNSMFEPNAGANKKKLGFTAVSNMENRSIWTRKVAQQKHSFEYSYRDIWNSEFKLIRKFIRDVADYRANSFWLVDFSSGVKCTALSSIGPTATVWNASIYDTTDFSATQGTGGNRAMAWYPDKQKFRIGIVSSKQEDSSITWSESSDYGDLNEFAEGRVYIYPMYRAYVTKDDEDFKVRQFVDADANASFAGPVRTGKVQFIQRDVR